MACSYMGGGASTPEGISCRQTNQPRLFAHFQTQVSPTAERCPACEFGTFQTMGDGEIEKSRTKSIMGRGGGAREHHHHHPPINSQVDGVNSKPLPAFLARLDHARCAGTPWRWGELGGYQTSNPSFLLPFSNVRAELINERKGIVI